MNNLGIKDDSLLRITNYLNQRQVDNVYSDYSFIECGVPQRISIKVLVLIL